MCHQLKNHSWEVVIFRAIWYNFRLQPQKFFLKKPARKKFLIFFRKKIFLYFGKWNFLAWRLKNFRKGLSELKKHKDPPQKNLLYLGKWNFLSPSLKSCYIIFKTFYLYFRKEPAKSEKQTFCISVWSSLAFRDDCW